MDIQFSRKAFSRWCPSVILSMGRLLLRSSERRRLIRDSHIRRLQDSLISVQYDYTHPKLIVYIVDGADWVTGKEKISGGIISIASIFEETERLRELHKSQVIMVSLNSLPLISRHIQFENEIDVFRLSQVFSYFQCLNQIIMHVPELLVSELTNEISRLKLKKPPSLALARVNIMNQNILKMPGPEQVTELKRFTENVTMTTAHVRYCTKEMSEKYGITVHNFSTFVSPEKYERSPYLNKADLMIASPDPHPLRESILKEIERNFPTLIIETIKNISYFEYRSKIRRAKWSITFGEGLDGYYGETVFSGGIGFAVYNDDFFPKEFKALPTIFSCYEEMLSKVAGLIKQLDNKDKFRECQNQQFELLHKYYKYQEYQQNIKDYYQENYHIPFADSL